MCRFSFAIKQNKRKKEILIKKKYILNLLFNTDNTNLKKISICYKQKKSFSAVRVSLHKFKGLYFYQIYVKVHIILKSWYLISWLIFIIYKKSFQNPAALTLKLTGVVALTYLLYHWNISVIILQFKHIKMWIVYDQINNSLWRNLTQNIHFRSLHLV